AISAQRSYTTDELLIREGAPASAFFLIVSGRAVIEVVGPGGAVQRLQTIEAGSAVGWSWLVPPYRWEFDGRAVEPTTAIVVDGAALRELAHNRCCLGLHVVERLLIAVADRLKASRLQNLDVYAPPDARP